MPGQYTGQIRRISTTGGREIKASSHYTYIVNGITLDGSKFDANELILEGQCLVKDTTTGKYEKYAETTPGTFPEGKSDPLILDTSVQFVPKDGGGNADVIVGAAMIHGSVYRGMLIDRTNAFEAKMPQVSFIMQ